MISKNRERIEAPARPRGPVSCVAHGQAAGARSPRGPRAARGAACHVHTPRCGWCSKVTFILEIDKAVGVARTCIVYIAIFWAQKMRITKRDIFPREEINMSVRESCVLYIVRASCLLGLRPLRLPRACVAVVDLAARRVDELLPARRQAWRAGRRWRWRRAGRLGPRRLCSGASLLIEVVPGSREQQKLVSA